MKSIRTHPNWTTRPRTRPSLRPVIHSRSTTANKRDLSPDRSPDFGPESPPSDGFEIGDRGRDDKNEECPPGQDEVLPERKIGFLSSQDDLFDLERVVAPKSTGAWSRRLFILLLREPTAELFAANSERPSQGHASWPTGDPTSRAPVTESVAGEFSTLPFTCGVCDKTAADPVATICGHFFCHQYVYTQFTDDIRLSCTNPAGVS